jgi:hypothetical protein
VTGSEALPCPGSQGRDPGGSGGAGSGSTMPAGQVMFSQGGFGVMMFTRWVWAGGVLTRRVRQVVLSRAAFGSESAVCNAEAIQMMPRSVLPSYRPRATRGMQP